MIKKWTKRTIIVSIVLACAILLISWVSASSFRLGELRTCNSMLKLNPMTNNLGLYCELHKGDVYIGSTKINKRVYNLSEETFLLPDPKD